MAMLSVLVIFSGLEVSPSYFLWFISWSDIGIVELERMDNNVFLSKNDEKDKYEDIIDTELCRRGETTYAMGWLKWGPN
jgi:hypothetical protein